MNNYAYYKGFLISEMNIKSLSSVWWYPAFVIELLALSTHKTIPIYWSVSFITLVTFVKILYTGLIWHSKICHNFFMCCVFTHSLFSFSPSHCLCYQVINLLLLLIGQCCHLVFDFSLFFLSVQYVLNFVWHSDDQRWSVVVTPFVVLTCCG